MSADIVDRLTGIMSKERVQTSTDIREAVKTIKELREALAKAYDEVDSYRRFCRHLEAKRKEISEMLVIATRLMEYQKDPR
jgi:hypothetical protein